MAYTNIKKSSDYFNTKLYTGTGTSGGDTLGVTGVGFQPDFVWVKNRTVSVNHYLYDVVRGTGSAKALGSNTTASESSFSTYSSNGGVESLDSDGFTAYRGTDSTYQGTNKSGNNYVAWNWLANGAGSANTDGSISSTVSANTTSGFSIGTYTGNGTAGATIGHGLASDKVTIIVKRTDTTGNWGVKHYKIPATQWLQLDQTDGANTSSVIWNDTEPTSSVFSVGSYVGTNASGGTYVFYAFAEKQGFSKFGSYTGNSSTDGVFCYTGFKPAFLLIKNTSADQSWWMWDNKRIGYNGGGNHRFRTNGSDSEFADSTSKVDLLSNGFKWRDGDNAYNFSGNNFIYMAFAEQPLVGDNPATAR